MMNQFELGEKIRKRRKYMGKNQEEIARKIPVSKSQISKWENENSYPSLSDFEKLSEAMNICPADLVAGRIEEDWIKNKEKKDKITVWAIRLLTVVIICLMISIFVLMFRLGYMQEAKARQYDINLLYSRMVDNGIQEVRQLIKSKDDDVWVDIITYQQDGTIFNYIINEIVFTGHQTETKRQVRMDSEGKRLEIFVSYMDGSDNKISFIEVVPTN